MLHIKGHKWLWVEGLTLWPVVLYKEAEPNPILMNHEKIHLRQQLELGLIFFYVLYIFEWLILLIVLRSFKKAYRSISFEKEAFENQGNLRYLKERPLYASFRYYFCG